MTTYDLIDVYQFDFVSSLHKGNPKKYHTMVEELNEIREKYKNGTAIDDVLMLFEPFFGTLPSVFVEDILCIFKNPFRPMSIEIKGTNKALMTTGNCVFKNRKKQVVV